VGRPEGPSWVPVAPGRVEAREGTMIRAAETTDAHRIAEIYNAYVENSTVTFESEPVSDREMERRINAIKAGHDWLVYVDAGRVTGYAYYGPFRERMAYRATVESTVYVEKESQGRGLGTQLYSELIARAAAKGFCEMLGVIALPNESSVRLHERLGFRKVGHLERVGNKFETWIDVGIWQRHLKESQG
jgi:L-amino acid N-acyltransferase YncA